MRKSYAVVFTVLSLLATMALFQNCAEDIDLNQYDRSSTTDGSSSNENTPAPAPAGNAPTIAVAPLPVLARHIYVNGASVGIYVEGLNAEPYNLVNFSVIAESSVTTSYQWYRVSPQGVATAIIGATDANYSFLITDNSQAGIYRVVASNEYGSGMSEATLTIQIENVVVPIF